MDGARERLWWFFPHLKSEMWGTQNCDGVGSARTKY